MIDWGYVAGKLRCDKNYLLSYNELLRLSDTNSADNLESFLKYLKDSYYGDLFDENNLFQYETIFEDIMKQLYVELKNLIPEDNLIRLHTINYDLNNIKMIYKSRILGYDIKWDILSESGNYPPEEAFTIIEEKKYFNLPTPVSKALFEGDEEYKRSANIQIVDFIIDSGFNNYRFDILNEKDGYSVIKDYYSVWVDLENIKNIFRAKKMDFDRSVFYYALLNNGALSVDFFENIYSEDLSGIADEINKTIYGDQIADGLNNLLENNNFSLLEKQSDEYLMKKLAPFRYVSLGPEVVEEFLTLKKMEIKNLKIIFIGKLNDIQTKKIKERIRDAGI